MSSGFHSKITFREGTAPPPGPAPPEKETDIFRIILVSAIAAVLAVLSTLIYLRIHLRKLPKLEAEKALSLLSNQEREVVKKLIERDNLTQAELTAITGIPKATLSRVLDRLEFKGIVKRVQYGMSRKVLLRRWTEKRRSREIHP